MIALQRFNRQPALNDINQNVTVNEYNYSAVDKIEYGAWKIEHNWYWIRNW